MNTSEQAHEAIKSKVIAMHLQCVSTLTELGRATANEIASALTDNFARRTTLRRRVQELPSLGLAIVSGTKICNVSGFKVKAYVLT